MDGIIGRDVYTEKSREILRLNDELNKETSKIEDLYFRIGKLYATMHIDDEEYDRDFSALLSALKRSKENKRIFADRILELKEMVRCPECKSEVHVTATFCTVCGNRMKNEDAPKDNKDVIEALSEMRKKPGFDLDNFAEYGILDSVAADSKDEKIVASATDTADVAENKETDGEDDKMPCVEEKAEAVKEIVGEEITAEEIIAEVESEKAHEAEPEPEETRREEEVESEETITSETETAVEEKKEIKCRKCGTILDERCVFCVACGEKVVAETVIEEKPAAKCRKCGETLMEGCVFCASCGEKVEADCADEPEAKPAVKCRSCGAILDEKCAFCVACGKKVDDGVSVKTADEISDIKKNDENADVKADALPPVMIPKIPKLEEESGVKCRVCGAPLENGKTFCVECGENQKDYETEKTPVPVDDNKERCSECGTVIIKGDKECRGCGKPIFGALMMPVVGKCRRCGAKNKSKLAFCTKCGAKF